MTGARWALAVLWAASGCSVSRTRGHTEVAQIVSDRIGHKTHWDQGSPEDREVAKIVNHLLGNGLTRDAAVEIALVNNRALQGTYEELGISQADMVQAGLLKNPSLNFAIGFPIGAGINELTGSLVQDFLDLLVLPMRKKIAKERFAAEISRVAHHALATAAEVSKAFAAVQAAEQMVAFRKTVLIGAQGVAELSDRQYDAGNINDLTHDTDRVQYEQAQLDLEQEELELAGARERLNRLLGLWGSQTSWTLAQKLADPPAEEPPLEHLETLAIRQRLDVDMARKQVALMTRAVALARNFRLFGRVEVGLDAHQDPDGPRTVGVGLTLDLPIFDQRQAQIARLEAERRQTERRLEGIAIDVRSEVRSARTQLMTSRRVVDRYRTRLLPMRDRIVEASQLHYNGMLIGPFQLISAKQAQVETYRAYIAALLGYWNARFELERAVGGRIKPAAEAKK